MIARPKLTRSLMFSGIAKASGVFLLLLMLFAGRLLGDEAFGQFMFALSFVSLFLILTDGGTEIVFLREVAADRGRAPTLLGALLSWKVVLTVVAVPVIIGTARLLGMTGTKLTLIALLAVALVLSALKSALMSLYQALEAFGVNAVLAQIERTALFGFGVAVLWLGGGVVGLAAVFVGVRAADVIGTWWWVRRRTVRFAVGWDWSTIWSLQRLALPLVLAAILGHIHGEIDVLCLGWLRPDAEVGWYAAATRLMEFTAVLPAVLYTVLYPKLSALSREQQAHGRLSTRAMRTMVLLALPLAVAMALGARPLIALTFGPGFVEAAGSLRIIALALPFAFLNSVIDAVLLSTQRQRAILALAVAGLATGLTTCLLAIPRWGHLGAAMASVASDVVVAAIGLWVLAQRGATVPRTRRPVPAVREDLLHGAAS